MRLKKLTCTASGGFLSDTYRQFGFTGCVRKIAAAIKMQMPVWFLGRRTNSSVGAYFDLITDDARMFYGNNFHFGYFKNENELLTEALNNHTDIVAEMAGVKRTHKVLDIGCGVCEPAIRIAKEHSCHITGINISAEQVRQGRELVNSCGLSDSISVMKGNALALPLEDETFDSAVCLEVAGNF